MKKSSYDKMFIFEIILVTIGIILLLFLNNNLKYMIGFALSIAGGFGLIRRYIDYLSKRKKKKKPIKKSEYICPKCGSTNWKFPNPLKPVEHMVNIFSLVNNLLECRDCGHVGIFFLVDKDLKNKIKVSKTLPKEKKTFDYSWWYTGGLTFIFIFLFLFSPSILWTVILFGFAVIIFEKIRIKHEKVKK